MKGCAGTIMQIMARKVMKILFKVAPHSRRATQDGKKETIAALQGRKPALQLA